MNKVDWFWKFANQFSNPEIREHLRSIAFEFEILSKKDMDVESLHAQLVAITEERDTYKHGWDYKQESLRTQLATAQAEIEELKLVNENLKMVSKASGIALNRQSAALASHEATIKVLRGNLNTLHEYVCLYMPANYQGNNICEMTIANLALPVSNEHLREFGIRLVTFLTYGGDAEEIVDEFMRSEE